MLTDIERARDFAMAAHGDQKRKHTGEPYHHHLREVADIVASVGGSPEAIAAAWLHDTVEDTHATHEMIQAEFGETVYRLVWWLTDDPATVGNRAHRKALTRARLSHANHEAQTIKLADFLSNYPSIFQHDPKFAAVYRAEYALLLCSMRMGHAELRNRAVERLANEPKLEIEAAGLLLKP